MTGRTKVPDAGRSTRAAVFLDRDGTVIHDRHYLADPDGVELLPGAAEGIARLNRAGLLVVLVTNQSGIGRGYFGEDTFRATQARLEALLSQRDAHFDAVYHCPHSPDRDPPCDCRKPATGLFLRAAGDLDIDLAASFYVGDRVRDVAPAASLGGTPLLIGHADGDVKPPPATRTVQGITAAVELILSCTSD